jgi:broad specificity phosphatase PhoE
VALVVLVRHGQASFAGPDYDVLSPLGERQATLVGERLAGYGDVDRVLHGTLRRQRHTAELVVRSMADDRAGQPVEIPEVAEDGRWDEYDHEELLSRSMRTDGQRQAFIEEMESAEDPRRVFQQHFDAAVRRWTAGGHDDEYHESYTAFGDRVDAALDDLLAGLGRSRTAVVVTSGGVMGAISAQLLGLDAAGWARLNRVIVNTGIVKLAYGRAGTTLVSFNDHAHLEADPRQLVTYR